MFQIDDNIFWIGEKSGSTLTNKFAEAFRNSTGTLNKYLQIPKAGVSLPFSYTVNKTYYWQELERPAKVPTCADRVAVAQAVTGNSNPSSDGKTFSEDAVSAPAGGANFAKVKYFKIHAELKDANTGATSSQFVGELLELKDTNTGEFYHYYDLEATAITMGLAQTSGPPLAALLGITDGSGAYVYDDNLDGSGNPTLLNTWFRLECISPPASLPASGTVRWFKIEYAAYGGC
jgi:hypothetical protein